MGKRLKLFFFIKYSTNCFFGVLFSIYLRQYQGLEELQIVFLMSIVSLTSVFSKPTWAILADKKNNPILFLRLAYLVSLSMAVFFLFPIPYYFLILIYIVFDLFYGVVMPLTDSITIKYLNDNPSTLDFGKINIFGVIAWMVSSLFLGFMADKYGVIVSMYLFIPMLIVSFFCLNLLPKEKVRTDKIYKENFKENFKELLKNMHYMKFLTFYFFFVCAYCGMLYMNFNYIQITFNVSHTFVTTLGICTNLLELPMMYFSTKLFKKIGYRNIFIMTIMSLALYIVVFIFANNPYWFVLAYVLRGIVNGLYVPIFFRYVSDITGQRIKITAIMIYTSILSLGLFISSNIFGLIKKSFGYQNGYIVQLCITIIPLALIFILKIKNPTEKKESITL